MEGLSSAVPDSGPWALSFCFDLGLRVAWFDYDTNHAGYQCVI